MEGKLTSPGMVTGKDDAPNVDAAKYLCQEIVPRLDRSLLRQHGIWIVGTAAEERLHGITDAIPGIKMVGWVPSVFPYMNQTRVKLIPLLYGAGTKRKLVQALLAGTPTVSTTIGVEGLGLASTGAAGRDQG